MADQKLKGTYSPGVDLDPDDKSWYKDHILYVRDGIAGAFKYLDSQTEPNQALEYVCPCGCGRIGCVPIDTGEKTPHNWLWDGNLAEPTLHPSIRHIGGCEWHGWLKKGIWEWA